MSSTDTIHITSNDHSFSCPIIYIDTIHITSNDQSFDCPIIYIDTIHITSNDDSFDCPITYMNTIHITSNNCPSNCPIIYMDNILIRSIGNVQSSTWTLFTLLAMITHLTVQSSAETFIHIHLWQCLTESSSLANHDAIFVDNS